MPDANGVDLATGTYTPSAVSISVGGDRGLSWLQGRRDITTASIHKAVNPTTGMTELEVVIGASRNVFVQSGTTFTSKEADGSSLSLSGLVYTYRNAAGDVGTFQQIFTTTTVPVGAGNEGILSQLTLASGQTLAYAYSSVVLAVGQSPGGTIYRTFMRLQSVSSGIYQLHATYELDTATSTTQVTAWMNRVRLTALNTTVDPCSAYVNSCTTTVTWPKIDFGASGTLTDAASRVTTVTSTSTSTGIRFPGSSSDDVTVNFTSSKVASVSRAGISTNYAYADSGSTRTTTVTRGSLPARTFTFNLTTLQILSESWQPNAPGPVLTRTYGYDPATALLTQVTEPEGNYTHFTYDSRGNVTEVRRVSKTPGTPPDIVTSATFDATCTNAVTCNEPNTTTDAKGKVTNYTYDPSHGGVTSVTAPADNNGIRPQKRYSYTRLGNDGTPSSTGTWMLTGISACQTTASCIGTADEAKTTIVYGSGLLPTSITQASGDGSLSKSTTKTYDAVGNIRSVDGPLTGAADTSYVRYDAIRRPLGLVSPDPDGGGPLKARASRIAYNTDGTTASVEKGTDTAPTGIDFSGFIGAQRIDYGYDAYHRPIKSALSGGGTTYSVAQVSYDAVGRVDCRAVRMKPSTFFGSLPSACTQTTGTGDVDRITKNTYDGIDRVTKTTSAYGTAEASDDATTTYTNDGLIATATDANGNMTSYTYDGFDRLWKTNYPSPTKGSGTSSATDYEQLGYDANSNVTSRLLRGGTQTINYSYDNLNRLTTKDLPGTEPDVTYGYDLLGRLKSAATSAQTLSFSYDALGRTLTQTGPLGTVGYQYDAAGRRTRLTWPDLFYVTYDYLVTGEMTTVKESGTTTLATYGYDDLGRRTSLTRINGVVTSYGYDTVSRLTSLSDDLPGGTTSDITTTLSYNPANQLNSRIQTNDGYAWPGYSNVSRPYTANGLNQYATAGSATFGYDTKGNLVSDGTTSYTYDSENRMVATTYGSGATLLYDPLGRYYGSIQGSATKTVLYDGDQRIAEYDGATLSKRYVLGAGEDNPLFWYEGSTLSDRRSLQADERGSIVSVVNAAGTLLSINSYDEYGVPWSQNGKYGFTGQVWIPQVGCWYYKARFYCPTIGRFMQTDPTGYRGGMNWYNYVGSDPINSTDPTGLLADIVIHGGGGGGGGGGGWGLGLPGVFTSPNFFAGEGQNSSGSDGSDQPDIIVNGRCDATCQANRAQLLRQQLLQAYALRNFFVCGGAGTYGAVVGICGTSEDIIFTLGVGTPGPSIEGGWAPGGASNYLKGWSGSIHAPEGLGLSFDPDTKSVTGGAAILGTPGGSVTYGLSVSDIRDAVNNAFDTMGAGSYNSLGRPYDAESYVKPAN